MGRQKEKKSKRRAEEKKWFEKDRKESLENEIQTRVRIEEEEKEKT